MGGDVSAFVPTSVLRRIKGKLVDRVGS